ncbi:MAG: acyltransferase family protein [Verrucomicrobiota bacterium]
MRSGSSHPAYRADIDGLRGIAVLLVVLFHARISFRGGYVGVDVFFVISGYLITMLMMKDFAAGTFSLIDFWERRIRRIFPALAVMTLATTAVGTLLLFPEALQKLGESLIAQVLIASNIYFWKDSGGYFAGPAEEQPLLHMWSLAVEEQFYVFMPLLCLLIFRRWSARGDGRPLKEACWRVFSWLLVPAFIFAVAATYWDAHASFYWLPMRAWELLLGSCLAALPHHKFVVSDRLRTLLATAALLTILVVGWVYNKRTVFPGLAALLPCLGTAVLIWAGNPAYGGNPVSRLLGSRGLVKVGLVSYSLYLWHWPVLAFINYLNTGPAEDISKTMRVVLMGLAYLAAWVSWRWVETPVRRRLCFKTRTTLFASAFSVLALMLAFGAWLHQSQGLPQRVEPKVFEYANAGVDDRAKRAWVDNAEDAFRDTLPEIGKKTSGTADRVLLWGDSHAMTLMPVVAALCEEQGSSGRVAAHSATVPMLGYYRRTATGLDARGPAWGAAVLEIIKKRRIPDVILTAYWKESTGKDPAVFAKALLETVRQLREAGPRVWIVLDVPEVPFDVPKALALHQMLPEICPDPRGRATTRATHLKNNKVLVQLVPELEKAGAKVLDPSPFLFNGNDRCVIEASGHSLYSDAHHLTIEGTLRLKPLFAPIFEP